MLDPHDQAARGPVSVRAVLTPRILFGALVLGGGAVGVAATTGHFVDELERHVWLPIGVGVLGLLQVVFGDRPLAKVIGLCLAALGLAATVAVASGIGRYGPAGADGIGSVVIAFGALLLGGFVLARAYGHEVEAGAKPGRVRIFNIWSGEETSFGPRPFNGGDATAVMGGFELDLREALLEPGETATLDVLAVMGGGAVVVPEHWDVENRVTPFMGGVSVKAGSDSAQGGSDSVQAGAAGHPSGVPRPCLRLVGLALMGGLEVKRG